MNKYPQMHHTPGGTPVMVSGSGPTVVLIHGVMVDHRMWHRQVDALSSRYRVVCLDMLGHGAATDPPGERTLNDFVAQAMEVVRSYSADGDRVVLGGFSMGGLITQACAIDYHQELAGIVLLNAVHNRSAQESERVLARYGSNVSEGVDNAIESAMQRWFTDRDHKTDPNVIQDVQAWMRHGDFAAKCKAHRVFVSSDAQLTGRLGVVTCPALVMTGERDTGSTPAMTQAMAQAIPDARACVLDDQHHMMPVLDAPRVNEIILDFLASCQSTG